MASHVKAAVANDTLTPPIGSKTQIKQVTMALKKTSNPAWLICRFKE